MRCAAGTLINSHFGRSGNAPPGLHLIRHGFAVPPSPPGEGFLDFKLVEILIKGCQLFEEVCHLIFQLGAEQIFTRLQGADAGDLTLPGEEGSQIRVVRGLGPLVGLRGDGKAGGLFGAFDEIDEFLEKIEKVIPKGE